jgi:hypothetical protein
LSAFQDSSTPADVDVSMCFDNAQAPNTAKGTGKVLPNTTPADEDYAQITDELAQSSDGQWQVVGQYQPIYYPRAKECKP